MRPYARLRVEMRTEDWTDIRPSMVRIPNARKAKMEMWRSRRATRLGWFGWIRLRRRWIWVIWGGESSPQRLERPFEP